MDVHSVFLYGLNHSTFSLQSKILPSSQDEYRGVSRRIDACNSRNLGSSLAERRGCPHSTPLTLPRKRSIRSLAPKHAQDAQASRSSSSPPFRSVKRTKEAVLPLPSPQPADTNKDTAVQSTSLLESPKPPNDGTTGRVHSASIGRQSELVSPKPLCSPIQFIQRLHAYETAITSTAPTETLKPRSSASSEKSEYRYYGPMNPFDQLERFPQGCSRVPRRQLSYGDPKPWSPHRITGSQELRLKASLEAEDNDSFFWGDDTTVGSDIVRAKPWYSEPTRPKPRLWPDFVDDGEPIEEAQATVVKTSPSKPKEVSIPPRRSSNTISQPNAPDSKERGASDSTSTTPPESVIGLGISAGSETKQEKEHKCYERIKARNDWHTTVPNSSISTPWSTGTVRHISQTMTGISRPGTPRPPLVTTPQLSELTTWILTELEVSIKRSADLQLDSPVLVQIRLPPGQCKLPRTPPTIPLSRFATFRSTAGSGCPLSSHPPSTPPNSFASSSSHTTSRSSPSSNHTKNTLHTFHTIFPRAPNELLSILYATYLALHYAQSIHISTYPSPKGLYTHPCANALDVSYTYNYIPSKARAMLGLQTPVSRPPLPKFWLEPQQQLLGWRERIEKLEVQLRKKVGRMIRECVGFEFGVGVEEVLVRAVGEVVRLGDGARE